MRVLEVRRHTMRSKPGKHLSQAGVSLARRIGETMGPFDRVVTSTLARAFETAIAMGFAVDERCELLSEMSDEVDAEVDWTLGFPEFTRAIAQGGATDRFAAAQAALWTEIVSSVGEGGRALIVSHGGIIEAGTIGCLPGANHAVWGGALDYCEGVRLSFADGRFRAAEILRMAERIDERV